MPIYGNKEHSKRLGWLTKNSAREVARQLYKIGQEIELDAERSITEGSVSGKNHVPSNPGEPPNADTRHLDSNIETELVDFYKPRVTVTSKAEYSSALEFGTEKMAARPFMRPALERHKGDIAKSVKNGVNAAIRKSK